MKIISISELSSDISRSEWNKCEHRAQQIGQMLIEILEISQQESIDLEFDIGDAFLKISAEIGDQ